jgi:phosphatidylglycerol:prolipoprotein diacylglycerol transferase
MPLFVIRYPEFDPILVHIGPFAIRWYALAYIAGILLGWLYARAIIKRPALWGGQAPLSVLDFDDFILWVTFGIIFGGRLGQVLFYDLSYYAAHPLEIVMLWHGGMSFHGGFLGCVIVVVLFARQRGIPILALGDLTCAVGPIGLFLGRCANFINGELWGRPSNVPWAMIFPRAGDGVPRHPSQLYEAGLEGLALLAVLALAIRFGALKRRGLVLGLFMVGYGIARSIGEVFRVPDAIVISPSLSIGTALSLPMILIGLIVMIYALRRKPQQS